MTIEGIRLKIQKFQRKGLASFRRKQLINFNFTIISNNCWGGIIYESYGLSKQSPTVGLFFMADDYIKFLARLKEYLTAELTFIKPETSRWKEQVCSDKIFGSYPVGMLEIPVSEGHESIEIFFLHYHSEEEAKCKWERRSRRINFDHLLVKFNDQNGCTDEHIKTFNNLPFKNKICFTVKKHPFASSVMRIKTPTSHSFIRVSYEPFGRKITKILNKL